MTSCSVDECNREGPFTRGWCRLHYTRWQRWGDPLHVQYLKGTCSVDGCDRRHYAKRLCNMHWCRLRTHGDPSVVVTVPPVEERFWAKVNKTETCWLWTGTTNPSGYGQMRVDYKLWTAHRWSYTHFVGPILDGLEIDHLCNVRNCVRPEHLEAVTRSENIRRMHERRKAAAIR